MKTRRTIGSLLIILALAGIAFPQSKATKPDSTTATQPKKPLVTFVELGSVKCIPCRQMQPVMKAIEKKYGDQVRVVFHDVWTDTGSTRAEEFDIKLIPTQVFLDAKGKEFFRHEGFYPESEIDKLLQKRGLKIRSEG
jgi:thioredoxin 1